MDVDIAPDDSIYTSVTIAHIFINKSYLVKIKKIAAI